jgi:hypothetical protein
VNALAFHLNFVYEIYDMALPQNSSPTILMPTISERQLLIEVILLAGKEDTDQCHRTEPIDEEEIDEMDSLPTP